MPHAGFRPAMSGFAVRKDPSGDH